MDVAKVMFGQYLPDLPATDNPGLTEALNCLPTDKFYRAYRPLSAAGNALSERPRGGISAYDSSGNGFFYVGTETTIQQKSGIGWTDKSGATYTTGSDSYWRFAQFDDLVIGTNYEDVPQSLTVGSGSNFADLALTGTAPQARHIGIVGRHVVLGDTIDGTNGTVPHRLQWCRIDDPTEWPVPNSADALVKQAGEQFMPGFGGAVTGIVGNDQFGIVFQRSAVSRMTYVGGDLVYQFDVIDAARGAAYPNAIVPVGDMVYFIAADGFYVTDGVSVKAVGVSRFDRHFTSGVDTGYKERVYGALDRATNLIHWVYPGSGNTSGRPNMGLVYNYREDRITRVTDEVECLVSGITTAVTLEDIDSYFGSLDDVVPSLDDPFWKGGNEVLYGFTADFEIGTFAGTPGVAVIDGAESELNAGWRSHISGIAPMVQSQSAVTVSLGTRNALTDAVSYGSAASVNSRTRFADFRRDARYARARVSITGDFPAAQGVLYRARRAGL